MNIREKHYRTEDNSLRILFIILPETVKVLMHIQSHTRTAKGKRTREKSGEYVTLKSQMYEEIVRIHRFGCCFLPFFLSTLHSFRIKFHLHINKIVAHNVFKIQSGTAFFSFSSKALLNYMHFSSFFPLQMQNFQRNNNLNLFFYI